MNTIDTTTQKISLDASKTWFSADQHFSHAAAMEFCNRPFETVDEMNQKMWDNLSVVQSDETLVVLGDLTWNKSTDIDVKNLPGKHRIMVKGNHDKGAILKSKKWSRICDYLEVTAIMPDGKKRKLVLSHYPMVSWSGARSSIHLHGHTHGIIAPMATEFGGRMDVGVDVWNYRPIRLSEIISKLDEVRKNGFAVPGDY